MDIHFPPHSKYAASPFECRSVTASESELVNHAGGSVAAGRAIYTGQVLCQVLHINTLAMEVAGWAWD
jgi:hypothetical protein